MSRPKKDWTWSCRPNRGRWRAEFEWRPTGLTGSQGFATEVEARVWLAEMERRCRSGNAVDPDLGATTFGDYFETVFYPALSKAPGTMIQQENLYRNHVKDRWGDVQLRAITTPEIKKWRKSLENRKYALRTNASGTEWRPAGTIKPSTQRNAYWVLHQTLSAAVEDGYLVTSPSPAKSGLPRSQPHPPEHVLTPPEVDRLAAEFDDPDLVYVLAYGGFRQGEAFAIRVDDLDFGRNVIRIDEKVREEKGAVILENIIKTHRGHRQVPMPTEVMTRLRRRIATRGLKAKSFLFTNSTGGLIGLANYRSRTFIPAAHLAGFGGMTGHDLRHTAASFWFDAGFDIVIIARWLGDTVRVAEETYVHLRKDRDIDAVAQMDAHLSPTPAPVASTPAVPVRDVRRRRRRRTVRR